MGGEPQSNSATLPVRRGFKLGAKPTPKPILPGNAERGLAVTSPCDSGPWAAAAYFLVRVASPWLTRSSNVCAVFGWVARNTPASAMSSAYSGCFTNRR